MNRALKRRLALAVAFVAILAGGAIATVSATGQDTSGLSSTARAGRHRGPRALLTVAAGYLGVSPAQLSSELRSGKTLAQIADATAGKSEAGLVQTLVAARKAQLDKAASALPQRIGAEVNRPLLGAGGRRSGRRGAMAAARSYLGLSALQLRSDLRSGRTLGQIAAATPGKSEAGLVEAIVASKTAQLNEALSAGTLTKTRESAKLAGLTKRVEAMVKRVHLAKKSP